MIVSAALAACICPRARLLIAEACGPSRLALSKLRCPRV
jgi:hypothetical protein